MTNKGLYVVIALLVVVVAGFGYAYYRESQTTGISIEAGDNGISIEAD